MGKNPLNSSVVVPMIFLSQDNGGQQPQKLAGNSAGALVQRSASGMDVV